MQITIRNQNIAQPDKKLVIMGRGRQRAGRNVTLLIISIGDERVKVLSTEVRAAIEALEKAT